MEIRGFGFQSQTSCLLLTARLRPLPAPSMAPFPHIRSAGTSFQIPNFPNIIPLEIRGFEPLTSSLQSWRSSQLSYIPVLVLPMVSSKSLTGNYQPASLLNINRIKALHSKKGRGREEGCLEVRDVQSHFCLFFVHGVCVANS